MIFRTDGSVISSERKHLVDLPQLFSGFHRAECPSVPTIPVLIISALAHVHVRIYPLPLRFLDHFLPPFLHQWGAGEDEGCVWAESTDGWPLQSGAADHRDCPKHRPSEGGAHQIWGQTHTHTHGMCVWQITLCICLNSLASVVWLTDVVVGGCRRRRIIQHHEQQFSTWVRPVLNVNVQFAETTEGLTCLTLFSSWMCVQLQCCSSRIAAEHLHRIWWWVWWHSAPCWPMHGSVHLWW